MTSLSLRKRRTIRPSILRKAAAKGTLVSAVAVACLLTTSGVSAVADDGAISLRSVLPAKTVKSSAKSTSGKAVSDVGRVRFESGPSTPVPDVPKSETTGRVTFAATDEGSAVRPRSVLLTAGQDDAATITIPDFEPPEADAAESQNESVIIPSELPSNSKATVGTPCNCPECQTRRRGKRSPGDRIKGCAKRLLGCFIEVEECQEVHFDVDDYPRPILLVAATDDDIAEQNDDQPSSRLLSRKLSDIQPTLAYAYGDERKLPEEFFQKVDQGVYQPQVGPKMVLNWEPTNLWYYPLYFQDPGLERYGHTRTPLIQPFVSTGRFFGQVVGLPYQMTLDPPKCPQYTLGYYQPGEWAPKKKYQIPWNEEAAATQFLFMTGFFLMVP